MSVAQILLLPCTHQLIISQASLHRCVHLQNVGDIGLGALANGCTQLREVVLSHCRKISDTGLGFLANSCTGLEVCHMVYCPSVTQVGVATVVAGCPGIKKVLVEKWKVTARTRRRAAAVLTELSMDLL